MLDVLTQGHASIVITSRILPTHSAVLLPLRSRLSSDWPCSSCFQQPLRDGPSWSDWRPVGAFRFRDDAHCLADGLGRRSARDGRALAELEFTAALRTNPSACSGYKNSWPGQSTANMPTLRDIASLTAKYFGRADGPGRALLRRQALVAGAAWPCICRGN